MRPARAMPSVGEAYPLTFDEMSYNEQSQVFDALTEEGLDCDDIVFGVYRRTNSGMCLMQIGVIH